MITDRETYYASDTSSLYSLINRQIGNGWKLEKIWQVTKWKLFRYVTIHYATLALEQETSLEFNWGPVSEKQINVPLTEELGV